MLLPIAYPIRTPRLFFKDSSGKPLVGGKIFSYNSEVEADTFKPTYRDAFRTALNKKPIVLDNAGSAFIYIFTATRLEVFDKNGNWIERRYLPQTEYYAYFYDQYGYPLKNGKVWTYDIQSTIKKPSYQDAEQTLQNANPVILDENGGAAICIAGAYRLRIYNSKNVFITDQDFKQENRFVLTSKTYPLYFVDGITTNFRMLDATTKVVMNSADSEHEQVETSLSILSATIRDVMNSSTTSAENIATSFRVIDATIRSSINTTSQIENMSTAFALTAAKRSTILITNTMQPEKLRTSFGLVGAQITN